MSDERPARVRVTGPPRRPVPRRTRAGDVDQQTALGGLYLGSLLRVQLGLALRVLAVLALSVGMLPLLLHVAPGLYDIRLLGVPLPWAVLGGLVYPWLVVLGLVYVRRAERHERDFIDLLEEIDRDEPGETGERGSDRP